MADNTKNNTETSKSVRHAIEEKIAAALAEYKDRMGEKKFNEKVEKAAKLFVKSIVKHPVPVAKKAVATPAKKVVKKVAKKAVKPAGKVATKKTAAKKT